MLNKIIEWSVNNKLIVGILTLGLIIWGVFSLKQLPIDAVPDITNNQVQIVTSSPSSGAEDIERFVTFPVEQTMATIPGIEEIRSFSRFGLSVVTVVFTEDTDIYWARQQVAERLSEAKNQIPAGFGEPYMAPLTTGLGEIYQYIVKAKKGFEKQYDATELRAIQDWIIRRQLLGVPGVADVSGFGGKLKQYEIAIDLVRLKGFDLTVSDVFKAIEANNQNTGGAYIEKNSTTTYIRTDGLMKSLDDVEQTVIKHTPDGYPVQVKDVANVHIGSAVRYGALTYNAEGEVVGGIVLMLKGANSSKVIRDVKERMDQITKTLPKGVEIEVYLDRTKLVNRAISTVTTNLLEGALIVITVLVLLLGNFRAGLIVASVIPLAMLFAISLMNVFGVSGNLMSLGALDFGLIVDGAVIIVESTLHILYHKGNRQYDQAAMNKEVYLSASKFSKSAVFGQIIILVVYLPLLALIGIEGKMFRPMAQTVMFAIIGALILSLTYVPMISALFLNKTITVRENVSDKIVKAIRNRYQPALKFFIRKGKAVLASLFLLLLCCGFLFTKLGAEFIPSLDEGDFAVETRLITGTSLTKTIETTSKLAKIIKDNFPEVIKVVGKIGTAEIPTDPMPMEACDLMVILKDKEEWTSAETKEELAEKMQKKMEENIPGVSYGFQQPIQMRFNELMTGAKQDVVVKIYGENLDKLGQYARQIGKLSSGIKGVQDVYVEEMTGSPQLIVSYDREALAKYNISIEEVNRSINISFAGQAAGIIFEGEKRFDLVVKLDSASRTSQEDLKMINITSPLGVQVPLSQLASVDFIKGPNQIQRDEAKRRIIVGFNVRGRDVASIVEELKQKIDKQVTFDVGYYPTFGGTFKNLENASARLMVAVPIALFLIFFLLYLTFKSFKQALLIYTAIPLAALGGVLALWLRGMPFSISAGVGFIALFGVAVLNGIVLISEFNSLEKSGYSDRLRIVLIGTRARLRPVLLTALVASLGFVPMAISHGSGAEVQKPLATVVIGGLITATILTLFVLPIFYLISERKMKKRKSKQLVLMLLILLSFKSFGQDKKALTLDECLSIAQTNNPALRSAFIGIEKEIIAGKGKMEMPKTNVSMMVGQYNSFYNRDNNFTISQTIPFPTVFIKEKALGEARSGEAKVAHDLLWKDLKYKIQLVYQDILFYRAKAEILAKQDSIYALVEKRVEFQKQIRDISKLDAILIANERKEIQNETRILREKQSFAEFDLKHYTGSEEVITAVTNNTKLLTFIPVDDTAQLSLHPELLAFNAQQEILEKEKQVVNARALPDIALGYVNQTLVGPYKAPGQDEIYFDQSQRFQAGIIGLEIPVFFGSTKRKSAVIKNGMEQNKLNQTYVRDQITSDYQKAYIEYNSRLLSLEMFDQQLLPQAEIIREQAQIQWEAGEISMIEYLLAKERSMDIALEYLALINEINQSVHKLNWFVQNDKN